MEQGNRSERRHLGMMMMMGRNAIEAATGLSVEESVFKRKSTPKFKNLSSKGSNENFSIGRISVGGSKVEERKALFSGENSYNASPKRKGKGESVRFKDSSFEPS